MTPNQTDTGNCNSDRAPQPHGREKDDCAKAPYNKKEPDICPKPKPCEGCCTCPSVPEAGGTCLDSLIIEQTKAATLGEEAKKAKSELEAIQAKLKQAMEKYTPEAYAGLLKRWEENDKQLKELIRNLACSIPCWYCVIECEICPLINAIAADERLLNGTGVQYDSANSLYDQRYWWERERQLQQDAFDRVNKVMAAWQDPLTTIDGVLKTVAADVAAASAGKVLSPDLSNKLIYEVFFRLLPLHLAIAPPAKLRQTGIAKKYVTLCHCDTSRDIEACCGPNVGPLTVRERLIGPQPFLIAPDEYPGLICCLATDAYQPAKAALATATANFNVFDAKIEATKASIAARLKSLPADAKARLGKTIDCNGDDYQCTGSPDKGHQKGKCCKDGDEPMPEQVINPS